MTGDCDRHKDAESRMLKRFGRDELWCLYGAGHRLTMNGSRVKR